MEKLTFLSLLLHFAVFIASTSQSSSILLNDRSFEIPNLPSSRAEKLIRELNLFPNLEVNVIDVGDSTLTSDEELPSIVERRFIFPNILPDGGPPSLEDLGHHAGYYKLPKSQGARMFYFFFESRSKKDAPLVIWLTGGPGCSSELAMFYENGPFKLDKNMSLAWNEYGWDQASNLLYVDQPVGTGFSYTSDKTDIRHDQTGVSDDLYDFLQAFFAEHPKLANKDFYITGESYAGHYIPAFASRVHRGNKANEGIHGFAIGNGLTDPAYQYPAYPDYAFEMGLITQAEHDRLTKIVPLCELSIKICGTDGTTSCLASYLVCNTLFSGVINHAHGVNYYDVRKKCEGSLCYDFSDMEKFLNLNSVRKSLGVGEIEFVSCSTSVYQAMLQDLMRNLEVGIPELLEDGINLLVYAGEYDLICNWLGNSRWVHAMEWSGKENFKAAKEVPFVVDGKEAGKVKSYEQLSFLKVHDAGHMVPMDQPKSALKMLEGWMKKSLGGGAAVSTTTTEEDDMVAQIPVMMATTPACLRPPPDPPPSTCMYPPLKALWPVIPPEPPDPPDGPLLLVLQTVLSSVVSPSSLAAVVHLTLLLGAALLCTNETTGSTQPELWLARSVPFCIYEAPTPLHAASDPLIYAENTFCYASALSISAVCPSCSDTASFTSAVTSFGHKVSVCCTFMSSLTESYEEQSWVISVKLLRYLRSFLLSNPFEIHIVSLGSFFGGSECPALCMAKSFEFSSLKVFSDNSTLIRAISGNIQSKEIIGIVSDIRSISSGFATIVFSCFFRSENLFVYNLAKQALQPFLLCTELFGEGTLIWTLHMGIFDGLPVPSDKTYLREELARIDESWVAARFDSLPHVVHIITSKDRETDILLLREQSDVVEEVVDEVVHAYHGGFNKAIQNYSQILRLFSESTDKIGDLKHDLAEAKKSLGTRNKQLHQLWYRSVTLRHIIALLDQIEGIAKVPSRIEKLIADKQFYAAIQVYLQSSLMLEREGLQTVGALQDVRSELAKLRGALFFKILDDLHAHLYNRGEYSSVASSIYERDDEVPTTTAVAASRMSSQPLSRRTRTLKGDSQFGVRGLTNGSHRTASTEEGSSFDGHDEEDSVEHDEATGDGQTIRNGTDSKLLSYQLPPWLSDSSPDEFIEAVRKSDDPLHVKYLQTLVQCLCMLGKVAAAAKDFDPRYMRS
ncbi:hypothetical protein IGI04_020721 [Brassica rapa subsp. trilocularis]|uniref:Exocyst complex component Sec8 n=1 Tax=Brassica rapa subsp. trilocularis TaxID=1813537 RepID=A0ABQ7MJT3_BRACM|nr:hypothetical protein IGI04_020721 [Brassica rapa subsp. trilocularis]